MEDKRERNTRHIEMLEESQRPVGIFLISVAFLIPLLAMLNDKQYISAGFIALAQSFVVARYPKHRGKRWGLVVLILFMSVAFFEVHE